MMVCLSIKFVILLSAVYIILLYNTVLLYNILSVSVYYKSDCLYSA